MPTTRSTYSTHEPSPDLSPAPQSPPPACPLPPACRRRAGCLLVGPPAAAPSPPSGLPPAGLLAPNFQWSAEQMDALFAIVHQKAELELQAAIAKARHEKEESLARIAAIRAPTSVARPAAPKRTVGKDEEASIG